MGKNDYFTGSPVVGDLDRNAENCLEVIMPGRTEVIAWHADGSLVDGWPIDTSSYPSGSPITADVDNNPSNGLEIITSHYNQIEIRSADSSIRSGWPWPIQGSAEFYNAHYAEISVGNIDGNMMTG